MQQDYIQCNKNFVNQRDKTRSKSGNNSKCRHPKTTTIPEPGTTAEDAFSFSSSAEGRGNSPSLCTDTGTHIGIYKTGSDPP